MRAILDDDAQAVAVARLDVAERIAPSLPRAACEPLRARLGDELASDDVSGGLDVEACANGGAPETDADDVAPMGRDGPLRRVSRTQPARLRRHLRAPLYDEPTPRSRSCNGPRQKNR